MARRRLELTGRRFGRATVLHLIVAPKGAGRMRTRWTCLCSCGTTFDADGSHLKAGTVQSCGCLRREKASVNGKRRAALGRARAAQTRAQKIAAQAKTVEPATTTARWLGAEQAAADLAAAFGATKGPT